MSGRRTVKPDCDQGYRLYAAFELGLRRARLVTFGSGFCGDAWWDIMLTLYIGENAPDQDKWNIAGSIGLDAPSVERWLSILERHRHVSSRRDSDRQIECWKLSRQGVHLVEQCLAVSSLQLPNDPRNEH